jgi:hypothetical protein
MKNQLIGSYVQGLRALFSITLFAMSLSGILPAGDIAQIRQNMGM